MRRGRLGQRCLNAGAFANVAALSLAIARYPRLSIAAATIAIVAFLAFFVLSLRSVRR